MKAIGFTGVFIEQVNVFFGMASGTSLQFLFSLHGAFIVSVFDSALRRTVDLCPP